MHVLKIHDLKHGHPQADISACLSFEVNPFFLSFLTFLCLVQTDFFLDFWPIWVYLGCFVGGLVFVWLIGFLTVFIFVFMF